MPSPRKPLKRDLLKGELAANLRVDVSEILERAEAAAFLGYKHKKSMSNRKALLPCFYMGDLGRNGLALYVKSDLVEWRDDPARRREMDKLGKAGRPLLWPLEPIPDPKFEAKLAALDDRTRRFWGRTSD